MPNHVKWEDFFNFNLERQIINEHESEKRHISVASKLLFFVVATKLPYAIMPTITYNDQLMDLFESITLCQFS